MSPICATRLWEPIYMAWGFLSFICHGLRGDFLRLSVAGKSLNYRTLFFIRQCHLHTTRPS
jgi:hypothetical protein